MRVSGSQITSESVVSPPGHREELERPAADRELEPVGEGGRGLRPGLGGTAPTPRDSACAMAARIASHPGEGGVAGPEPLEPLVVVAPDREVGLRDDVGAVVAEAVDAADVVGVALGEDERAGGRRVDGVVDRGGAAAPRSPCRR